MANCRWCGQSHVWASKCPAVKAFVYHKDGVTVKRVEFFAPNEYAALLQTYIPPAYTPPVATSWAVTKMGSNMGSTLLQNEARN